MVIFWDDDGKDGSSYVYNMTPSNPMHNPLMCSPKIPPPN